LDQVINDDKFNTFKNYLAIWNYILMVNQKRRRRIKEGDVFGIELDDSLYGYGVVLNSILMGFYELKTKNLEQDLNRIVSQKFLFKVCVMKYAFKSKKWNFIDNYAVSDELKEQVYFFKQDPFDKSISVYFEKDKDCFEFPATYEEVKDFERAAVWDPEHVEDRLRDYFNGVPNVWVEQLRLKPIVS